MKKYIFLLFAILFSCRQNPKPLNYKPDTLVDDIGVSIKLNKIPEKVITLAPNLTEMIYELNEGNTLIGNTKYCNYPKEAKSVEKVGDMLSVDYEKIVSLKPDLIFMTVVGNSKQSYEKLKALGEKVFVSNPTNYAGIKKTFLDMGKIFHKEKLALQKIAKWDSVINKINNKTKNQKHPKAMFLVAIKPIMLVGKNSFINDILTIAGLQNIASDTKVNYPVFSREEVLKRNPEYIILFKSNSNSINLKSVYPEWKNINAIKKDHVIFVDADLFARPGPRYYLAVEFLYNKIHRQHK